MKRLLTIVLIAVLFFSSHVTVFSEETEETKRRDLLLFGLEGEITQLILTLQEEDNVSYNTELSALFSKTKSPVLRENIISFYTHQKNDELKVFALELLAEPYENKKNLVLAVLSYAAELKLTEASPLIRKILDSDNTEYRDKAIQTLGKIGNPEDASFLFEYLQSEIPGDEKQRLVIRQNVMAALGDLKAVETWEQLVTIAKDTDENVMIRVSAATALGKMEKVEAIPVLILLFEDADPALRTAAVVGLSNFSTPEAVAVILEGFKDSYYKVRLEAITASEKQKITDAVPYILYRAKSDPVENVKFRSFEALGKFNNAESNSWLSSLVNNDKATEKVRVKAAAVLLENNFDFIFSDIEKIMIQTLKDDKKTWLRYEMGKIVAATKNSKSASIASAYIAHKDTLTRSIGLDMYEKNTYPEVRSAVELIAADEKQGALQRRAKKILDK